MTTNLDAAFWLREAIEWRKIAQSPLGRKHSVGRKNMRAMALLWRKAAAHQQLKEAA